MESEKWSLFAYVLVCLWACRLVEEGLGSGLCGEKRGHNTPPPPQTPPDTQGDDRQQEDMGVIRSWRMLAAEDSEIR